MFKGINNITYIDYNSISLKLRGRGNGQVGGAGEGAEEKLLGGRQGGKGRMKKMRR